MQTLLLVAARRRELAVACLLAALMWVTRSHHFATLEFLPDASWAVFFIAGLLAMPWPAPAALLLNAGAIDYFALLGGVSDYCVTPAYPFLIPTYLALWASGRWAVIGGATAIRRLPRIAFALVLGVAGAFVISNASFYALAGYFDDMPLPVYTAAVAEYLPRFLEGAALYTGIALLILYVCGNGDIPHFRRTAVDRSLAATGRK